MRFVVETLWPYTKRSAGIRALFVLGHELDKLGHDVAYGHLGHHFFEAAELPWTLPLSSSWVAEDQERAIHVYPEVVPGNPSGADKVVRWFLNRQRYPIGTNELCVTWDDWANAPRLRVDVLDREYFYPPPQGSLPRLGTIIYEGKGIIPEGFDTSGAIQIFRRTDQIDREHLGDLFRRTKTLYTFDAISMFNEEASACGCEVVFADECRDEYGRVVAPFRFVPWSDDMAGDVENLVSLCQKRWGE